MKRYILEGVHKGQSGVILFSKYTKRIIHCILLGEESIISVPQPHLRLLDPNFILPFGVSVYRDL